VRDCYDFECKLFYFVFLRCSILGVIIFGSVWFLPIKTTKLKFCKIQKIEPKPVWFGSIRFSYLISKTKTQPISFDSFQFGLVWLFYIKNQKLYCFLGIFGLSDRFRFWFGLVFQFGSVFSSVRFIFN
jgi:hypothetical protein